MGEKYLTSPDCNKKFRGGASEDYSYPVNYHREKAQGTRHKAQGKTSKKSALFRGTFVG